MTIILTGREPVTRMYAGQSRLISATHLSFKRDDQEEENFEIWRKGGNREEQREVEKHVAAGGPKMRAEATQKNIPKK